jgi:hypothetical protein
MVNNCENEWVGMPEYDNTKIMVPEIEVTFKFTCKEDYDEFNKLIKQHLYDGAKVFDGMQTKTKKSAWYPPKEKASKYKYE